MSLPFWLTHGCGLIYTPGHSDRRGVRDKWGLVSLLIIFSVYRQIVIQPRINHQTIFIAGLGFIERRVTAWSPPTPLSDPKRKTVATFSKQKHQSINTMAWTEFNLALTAWISMFWTERTIATHWTLFRGRLGSETHKWQQRITAIRNGMLVDPSVYLFEVEHSLERLPFCPLGTVCLGLCCACLVCRDRLAW